MRHSSTWKNSYPTLTSKPAASLVKCHLKVGEVCILISTSKAFQTSRFQILNTTELFWTPPLVQTLSVLSKKASSHLGTLGKAVRQECLVYAHPSGHQRKLTESGNIFTLNAISHCRTILQCSWDKVKCNLFCQIGSWNLITLAITHLNTLTIRLQSCEIPLNLSQERISSHALDQEILWPSEMNSFSSSWSWLNHPAGTKWILEKASRTYRQIGEHNELIYTKPSDRSSTPLAEAPFYMVQFWKTSTLGRKASFHSN